MLHERILFLFNKMLIFINKLTHRLTCYTAVEVRILIKCLISEIRSVFVQTTLLTLFLLSPPHTFHFKFIWNTFITRSIEESEYWDQPGWCWSICYTSLHSSGEIKHYRSGDTKTVCLTLSWYQWTTQPSRGSVHLQTVIILTNEWSVELSPVGGWWWLRVRGVVTYQHE